MPATKDNAMLLRTRTTLIARLKNWRDEAGWQDFFDTYWRLIFFVALKSGLSEPEAQDVVQETMMGVARKMPEFNYDRSRGSFKAWLLTMVRWRIADQFRKRNPVQVVTASDYALANNGTDVGDYVSPSLEMVWENEWKENLLEAAMAKVKRATPKQYQIFDLYVHRQWSPEKVARTLGISLRQVYLAKHRITRVVKAEVLRLSNSLA